MIISKRAGQLSDILQIHRKNNQQLGFVPTMGALHEGHFSLIQNAKQRDDLTVVSIFVNPTQFNNQEDFRSYPVTIEKDIEHLHKLGCDFLFLPDVAEIYPAGYLAKNYPLGKLENILEGFYRPGHFQGVCQVVDRLLQIVNPDHLYLGQKDFQQCLVIQTLLHITERQEQPQLVIVETKRETDGLAMSSRNLRLDARQRVLATAIYRELNEIRLHLHDRDLEQLKNRAKSSLTAQGFDVDYVEIANRSDLSVAADKNGSLVALVAASIGNIRLIDNILLN